MEKNIYDILIDKKLKGIKDEIFVTKDVNY